MPNATTSITLSHNAGSYLITGGQTATLPVTRSLLVQQAAGLGEFTQIIAQASTSLSDVENNITDFDLTAVQGPFGNVNMCPLNILFIHNKSLTTALIVGGGANHFDTMFTGTITIPPSVSTSNPSCLFLAFPRATTTSPTTPVNKFLRLRAASGTVDYDAHLWRI